MPLSQSQPVFSAPLAPANESAALLAPCSQTGQSFQLFASPSLWICCSTSAAVCAERRRQELELGKWHRLVRVASGIAWSLVVTSTLTQQPIQFDHPIPSQRQLPSPIPPPLADSNNSFRPSSQDILLEIPVQQPAVVSSPLMAMPQGNDQDQSGCVPRPLELPALS